jgi:hypothetical protein
MICSLASSLWLAGCIPEHARFRRAVSRVEKEQQAVLLRIVSENSASDFGKTHGFSSIHSVADYQRRVPLRNFDQIGPWVDRAAAGEPNVLTHEAVRLFEPTGGSSGATKLIPYTRSLQREFQRGIHAWIADLFLGDPGLLAGQAYWSVSPVCETRTRTPGGIAVGFDDDTSYVGGWQKRLVNAVMAVPRSVRLASDPLASDIDAFRYATLFFLVRSGNLRLISIWSPSFLSLLTERLTEWGERIVYDLAHGTLCRADGRRSREVHAALRLGSPQETHAQLWPHLRLISCWGDANAQAPSTSLAALFPHARVQRKGLIATEAFVSFPLVAHDHAALSVRSHFFEFLPDGSDRPLLAHQLERGGIYNLVVTTGGGLYRYLLGDQIQVIGHIQECPLLRFVGRQDSVSDWFGEKLNDAHVSRVFEKTFERLRISPAFAMLACDTVPPPGYVLYLDADVNDELLARAAEATDTGLRENFHYDYARRLGQLECVRAIRVLDGAKTFSNDAARNGQRLGDIKVPALDRRSARSGAFSPWTDKSAMLS